MQEINIVEALRTPFGSFGGSLAEIPAVQLATTVMRGLLEKSGIAADAVDEVIIGQVLSGGCGQAPARQAMRAAGLSDSAHALTINTVCGRGSQPYNSAMLLALLFYGYATGVFSSRKLERNTYDSVAFRYIAANSHPDHDTIATFRKRFLKDLSGLFVQILMIARQMEMLVLGSVSLDGSKVKANASKHKALSYD